MLGFLLCAALWSPLSFLLHNVIHEGAHALVARWAGCTGVRLYPWPSRLGDGRWTFAHMTYDLNPSALGSRLRWLSVAPVLAEALWWLLGWAALLWAALGPAGGLGDGLSRHWWVGVLAVEPVSALVDLTTWVLPWWRPASGPLAAHPLADAEVHRREFGFTRLRGKLWSLLLLVGYAAVAALLITRW